MKQYINSKYLSIMSLQIKSCIVDFSLHLKWTHPNLLFQKTFKNNKIANSKPHISNSNLPTFIKVILVTNTQI